MTKANDISSPLFPLLRLALGTSGQNDVSLEFSVAQWQSIIGLSIRQGVGAIALDGLQKVCGENTDLASELNSPEMKALRFKWYGVAMKYEATYSKYSNTLVQFLNLCEREQHKVLLLKGYGLSLNYPIPAHRPCGDIDVFLFGDGEAVNQLVEKQYGVKVGRGNHHSVFSYGGFTFENHVSLMDLDRHKNHVSDEEIFRGLIDEGCDEIEVDGARCFAPSVKLNSVYLLRHMAHHFAVEKITLRHILDWALFVRANASKIDWDFVYGFAKDSGCTSFLNCLNGICVESLGFAAEDFPTRERDDKLQSRMLADILNPEFQEEIPGINHKLRYAIVKTRRILANRWKYRMVSDEWLGMTIWNLAKNRM